jgi:hypothetical protein
MSVACGALNLLLARFSATLLKEDTRPMLQDTISKIEDRIQNSAALGDEHRAELLKLLGHLKTEITALSTTHQEEAESIAALAELSARDSIGGLQSSVGEFETSHPGLAAVVNRIASLLANMGI